MDSKKSASDFPYTTYLNVLYKAFEIVDVPNLVAACIDKWYNQTLCRVNDSAVRLGVELAKRDKSLANPTLHLAHTSAAYAI
jgi:hypothetical protein